MLNCSGFDILLAGGVDEEEEEEVGDAVLPIVLGNGVSVLIHVMEDGKVHKSLFRKELVAHATFLVGKGATPIAVPSGVSGEYGADGALVLLHAELGFRFEIGGLM